MIKKLLLILFIFLTILSSSYAYNLKIRIYTGVKIDSISVLTISGKYHLINPSTKFKIDISNHKSLIIAYNKNKIIVRSKSSILGSFDSIRLKGFGFMNTLKLMPCNKKGLDRIYNDDIIVKIRNGQLLIINNIELEHYIPCVVEAESGNKNGQIEFYKVQSTICRTYALRNYRKHINEDYNLCDLEHCQVYKGRCIIPDILLAVTKTTGDVIIDSQRQLIDAAFHANCGGQTVNCEDVWIRTVPYLRSVPDTFCIHMSKALWEKTIAKKDMLSYLSKNNIKDTLVIDSLMKFRQDKRKSIFFDTIKLKQLRTYFDLKSAYFTIIPKGDSLLFKGKGNGHGIGLCQEGAMNMVRQGYKYTDVINHYYKNIKIINYNNFTSQKLSTFVK